jgi:hypothetical protein
MVATLLHAWISGDWGNLQAAAMLNRAAQGDQLRAKG